MTSTSPFLRAALPALLLSTLPGPLPAQGAFRFDLRPAPSTASAPRAEAAHERAERLALEVADLDGPRMRRIADLHVRASRLYGAADPRSIDCLRHAANLLHREDPGRAALLHERAADHALAQGDVLRAAHGYVDVAAHLQAMVASSRLVGAQWGPHARGLVAKAGLLAESPLLAEGDREAIRARVR